MSSAGEKVTKDINWITNKLGTLLGYKRGHQDVEYLPKFAISPTTGAVVGIVDPNNGPTLYPINAQGDIVATVVHRTDFLANLLAFAGTLGEISVATDNPAIVVHNGVANQAKAYWDNGIRGTVIAKSAAAPVAITVATSTLTAIPIPMVDLIDTLGGRVVSGGLTLLLVEQGVITCSVSIIGGTGGTYKELGLEYDVTGTGSWSPLGSVRVATTAARITVSAPFARSAIVGTVTKFRVTYIHDMTTNDVSMTDYVATIHAP